MERFWKNLKANIGSGLFLLLPLILALYIIGRLWRAVHAPVRELAIRLGLEGFLGVNGLFVLSGILLLTVVALVGHLVRSQGEGTVRRWAERKLLNQVPGYAYIRIILEARLGLAEPPSVRPALLEVGDGWQPVFLVESIAGSHSVVYIPDVPLAASGGVLVVETGKVTVLPGSVLPLDTALRRYGKGIGDLVPKATLNRAR